MSTRARVRAKLNCAPTLLTAPLFHGIFYLKKNFAQRQQFRVRDCYICRGGVRGREIMDSAKLERKVAEYRAGDGRAFDYIYECTNRTVYFAALYVVRDRAAAEDVTQETYLRALAALDSYAAGTNFAAWLTRIAKNLALNHVKKRGREQTTDFSDEAEIRKYGTHETELPYIFDLAAKLLKEDEYEILMLCQVAGYRRREVAQMLGMPIGTVTWKNNEALKKLKAHLKKEGGR